MSWNKSIKWIVLVVIFLLIAASLSVVVIQRFAPFYVVGFYPSFRLCKSTENGWACRLPEDTSYLETTLYPDAFFDQKAYSAICKRQGGKYDPVLWGSGLDSCDFKYKDAGKSCKDSTECSGGCIVPFNEIKKNYPNHETGDPFNCEGGCSGVCSEYPPTCGGWRYEIKKGEITESLCLI